MSDIVIVAGARTPMGGFQGSLAGVSAVDLVPSRSAKAARRHRRRGRTGSDHGLRPARRPEAGPGPPGRAGGRPARRHRLHHHQQAVRLGDEGGDAGPRPAQGWHQPGDGRRWHGKHVQRALCPGESPQRPAHGPRRDQGPHVPRRPGGRPYRPFDGFVRPGDRRQVRRDPRGDGRLCHRIAQARPGRHRRWLAGGGNRPGHRHQPQGRERGEGRRATADRQPGEDPEPQAGVPQATVPSPPPMPARSPTAPPRWS